MDVIPISTKAFGRLGEGVTHTLTGCYIVLTGVDEDGRQIGEFGSSEGNYRNNSISEDGVLPGKTMIIHIDVLVS